MKHYKCQTLYTTYKKNAINVIAAHVLTHRSENIYILCHCPYSLVPPNVRTFPSTFKVRSERSTQLHYMNKWHFSMRLNCILPINFHFASLGLTPSCAISL